MKKYQNVLMLSVIWALYYVAAGVCNKNLSSFVTGSCIRFLTFILLTVSMGMRSQLKDLINVSGVWPKLILVGCFGFLLDITAFVGLQHSSSAIGTVLLKTDVLMINVVSIFIYGMKFTKRDWTFTAAMLAGVMILLDINPFQTGVVPADVFFLLSAAFTTANAILIKHIQTVSNVPNNVIAYYNNFVTMLLFMGITLAGKLWETDWQHLLNGNVAAALLVGGAGQFFIYHYYYRSLRALPVWIVKVILLLIPVFSTLTEALLFKETIGPRQLTGGVIVIVSAAFLILSQRKKQASQAKL